MPLPLARALESMRRRKLPGRRRFLKIVHLADTHVIAGNGVLAGFNPEERLRAAVDSINAEQGDAAFAVVTGD